VLLRSSNLVPDELVLLDLIDGKMSPLFSPNEKFRVKTRGITVQVIPIPVADGKMSGRLFLPADYHPGKRYPLVFTTYLSTPGFNLGSGEVPILPLVVHGIAVFALDAREVNVPGKKGDFVPELRRLQYPLAAMQWVADKLSGDGIVDLKRIGVTGLSYGTEIAMYAYFSSNLFRAVSATTGSQAPMLYSMGGLGWEEWLKDRGFSDPNEDLTKWRAFSAALNARASLPPLLWQAPDGERQWCVESWFDLRRAGAQVEWMEYPDEGHVKRGPANRWWVQERNLDWFRFWLMDEEDADPWKKLQYERWRHMRANWYAATVGTSYGAVVASPGKQDHQPAQQQ
jgi:dipeptidyl aminopeptidase/acylaminoacyl peptidase